MNVAENVALAALLHSLERFRQRTTNKTEFEAPFAVLRDEQTIRLIEESERLACHFADESSSSTAEGQESSQTPLWLGAITQRIQIARAEKTNTPSGRDAKFYPLQPLSLFDSSDSLKERNNRAGNIFPVPSSDLPRKSMPGGYDSLWKMFLDEAALLPRGTQTAYLDSLLFLMRKYTWCVPGRNGLPEVSLYDHSRVAAAIAVCLHSVLQEEPESEPGFILIEGGISGIQPFIYNPSLNQPELRGGMARRMRGRSLFVNLLVKSLADYLNEQLEICSLNALWATGGRFLIIAPKTERTRERLISALLTIEQCVWHEFQGALGVVIADLVVSRDELQNFGTVRQRLDQAWSHKKMQQFSAPLNYHEDLPGEAWENAWALKLGEEICSETGRDLSELEKNISFKAQVSDETPAPSPRSAQSMLFDAIGRALAGSKTIQLRREKDWTGVARSAAKIPRDPEEAAEMRGLVGKVLIEFPQLSRVWLLSDEIRPREDANLSLRIADYRNRQIEFLGVDPQSSVAQGFELMVTHIRSISENGDGVLKVAGSPRYHGALRMDVDDLGYIIAYGLPKEERSIAHIANLSQLIEWFFSGYLNTLIAGKELDPIYATGDDLLVIGAWTQVLDLADEIQYQFRNFCGGNPDLHVSAGISLYEEKYPLGRAAREAGEQLALAKSPRHRRIHSDSDKDALAFLAGKIPWRKWREVRSLGERMIAACEAGRLSLSFVYNLLELYHYHIDPRRDPGRGFAGEDLIWLPRFKYSLVGNVKDERLRADLVGAIENNKHYLAILAGYVLLNTRHPKEQV
ncbi:MAG: hypothetical protein L0220_17090 [Acidobacteria bacterium]|nr:hypothetical protein [Acidobacteriota bacterium]